MKPFYCWRFALCPFQKYVFSVNIKSKYNTEISWDSSKLPIQYTEGQAKMILVELIVQISSFYIRKFQMQ